MSWFCYIPRQIINDADRIIQIHFQEEAHLLKHDIKAIEFVKSLKRLIRLIGLKTHLIQKFIYIYPFLNVPLDIWLRKLTTRSLLTLSTLTSITTEALAGICPPKPDWPQAREGPNTILLSSPSQDPRRPNSHPLIRLPDPILTLSVLESILAPGTMFLLELLVDNKLTVLLIVALSPSWMVFNSLHFPFSFSVPSLVVLGDFKLL